ncbi:PAP18, partial [Symbiodinium sp. CCMP2456]
MNLSFRVLALLLTVWVDAQKTSFTLRPPISGALTRAEVISRLRSFRPPAAPQRRLSSFPSVSKRFREDWQLDVDDLIEQVKVAPGRQGEAVVTWLTKDRHLPSALQYAAAGSLFRRRADGQVNVYTMQICLPNSEVMLDPLLGPPNIAFDFNQLSALINSSSFLPKDSDSWRYLPPEGDPWDFLARTNYCIDYKNPKAYYTSPYIHSVTLTNLRGGTDYNFQPEGSSRRFSFRTPPDVGVPGPYKLGVWADVGVTNVSFAVMTKMLQLDPDLLLTVGDLSYADGWAERWDIFGVMMEPLMSSRYHLAVPGNHELIQNNGIDLIHRYPMPFRESGSGSPFMFAHESGPVFVIGMAGSYSETDTGSAQWVFVEEKLRQVNRARTPWVIVMFHTPWYNSNNAHYLEGIKHQWDMEEMLYNHGVDVVFNGHVHSYERSHPVFNFSKDECGITHIVVGDAGNYEGPATYEGRPPGWKFPQPAWSAFREASYGPGMLTVLNATHAEWRWHRVACVYENKDHHPVNLSKFTYDGSRQSLGRTRPITAYIWDGASGPSEGPPCTTESDNSDQKFEASDMVMLVR